MNTKLQELTDKIYSEGVEKGNKEAEQIIAQARAQAEKIVAEATAEADAIVEGARNQASEIAANTKSELKLYAGQSINALKTQVVNLIGGQIVSDSVKAATANPEFMQSIIKGMTEAWIREGGVTIETNKAEELRAYFMSNAKDLLDKGVKINDVKGINTSFAISPEKGGYKVTFGDAEFVEYFKEFLRPQLIEMLF